MFIAALSKNVNMLTSVAVAGEGSQLVDRGDTTYGGRWVVNPSGGLISKGHPLGATGSKLSFCLVKAAAMSRNFG